MFCLVYVCLLHCGKNGFIFFVGHEKPAVAPRFLQKGQKQSGMNSMGMAMPHMQMSSDELSFRPPKSIMMNMPPPTMRSNVNSLKDSNKPIGSPAMNPPMNILNMKEPPPVSTSAAKASAEKPKPKIEKVIVFCFIPS